MVIVAVFNRFGVKIYKSELVDVLKSKGLPMNPDSKSVVFHPNN